MLLLYLHIIVNVYNMAKIKDLIGKKFGRLTVISLSNERGNVNQVKWNCICDCGNTHTVTGECLSNGKSKSCGCLKSEANKSKMDRETALYRNLYSHIRSRYKKKYGTDILPFADFVELSKQNCHYCGDSPYQIINDYRHDSSTSKGGRKVSDTIVYYNGLDRIDSKIGYLKDNVVPCCRRCNVSKLDTNYNDFILHIKKMYEHLYLKVP